MCTCDQRENLVSVVKWFIIDNVLLSTANSKQSQLLVTLFTHMEISQANSNNDSYHNRETHSKKPTKQTENENQIFGPTCLRTRL